MSRRRSMLPSKSCKPPSSSKSASKDSSNGIEERMEGGIIVWRKSGEKLEVENWSTT